MHQDPNDRPGPQRYPTTHLSIIEGLRDSHAEQRRRAYDLLIAAYWRPVYTHLRLRWNKDRATAEDITQDFFALAFEKSFFDSYDPQQARFRTFIRTCLDRFAAKEKRKSDTIKRGGSATIISIDYAGAEADLAALTARSGATPEELFEQEWVRGMFTLAVAALRDECAKTNRSVPFEIFRLYDLEEEPDNHRPSYSDLARQFGVKESDVTNYLAAMRRRFRTLILESLRQMTASEAEYREEARTLLGVEPE